MEEATVQNNIKKWKRRKRHIIIVLTFTLILISLAVILYIALRPDTCNTSGCIKTAKLIASRMDYSVDPCDDFYNFACGSFLKKTDMPKNKFSINSFTSLSDQVVLQLQKVLEEPVSFSEPKSFGVAKEYYKVCMDNEKIEKDNLTTIKNIFKKVGGWPILEGKKWNSTNFNWVELIYKLNKLGFDTSFFFKINIETDHKNNSKYILQIGQPDYGYTRDLMLISDNELIHTHYFNFIVESAIYLGADKHVAEEDAESILNFYKLMTDISLTRESLRNSMKQYNAITIGHMENIYPYLPWLKYLNTVLNPPIPLTKDEVIINLTPTYLASLKDILLLDAKHLANYMFWCVLKDVMSSLPNKMREVRLKFETAAVGITKQKERSAVCVVKTHKFFGLITGSLYVRKYFNPEAKQKAMVLIENIKNTFIKDILQKNEWMDEKTKQKAINKAKAMTVHIGYPDQLLDDQILDKFYENITVTQNFLECNININKFLRRIYVSRLRSTVRESEWILVGMTTAAVNAFYIFNRNIIGFPAGILQDIFFAKDRPSYVNYGSIGYIIGHEITHAFDDQGREFDEDGKLNNWWTKESEELFYNKSKRIINQYNTFVVPELYNITVNGQITVGENIADNGGVKTAYHAYISQYKDEEPHLPGLTSFNSRQMFWLSTASTWCSRDRPDYLHMVVLADLHSPTRFRVNGPLINSDEFAKDFNCPVGSKMNPMEKYKLW